MRTVTTAWSRLTSLALIALLASLASPACDDGAPLDSGVDPKDAAFAEEGKADGAIAEGSPEAIGALKVANESTRDVLSKSAAVGLGTRTTGEILAVRNGKDKKSGTADDVRFATLAQLDAVPYVGPAALDKLVAYARKVGFVSASPTDGVAGVCLPDASGEALTFFGECEDTTLRYCGHDGPVEVDCADGTDARGEPLECKLASLHVGYDCISARFTGGCGEITYKGSCRGDVLTYCESQAGGNVMTFDCGAHGLVCSDASGAATCVPPGKTGCGTVTAIGTCAGTTATWCDDFEVSVQDCAATDEVCGADGDDFRCIPAHVAGGASAVSGSFVFEKKKLGVDGLGAISKKPVRKALVTLRKVADDSLVTLGYTAQDGSYSLRFDASEEMYVLVTAQGEPGKHNHSVRDCPMEDCADALGSVYGAKSDAFMPGASTDLGRTVITVRSGIAGAFNIYDVFVAGADFAKTNIGSYPPTVNVEWKAGLSTSIDTSYFSGSAAKIFILGTLEDTDEYDDTVLLHEYGHYLEFYSSRTDSPGGYHDGSPTDPRLAWGEGYGTYIGCAIADTPIYIDTSATGASVTDLRTAGNDYLAKPRDQRSMRQLLSENLISQILWTVAMGSDGASGRTHAPTFDVLTNYFTSFGSPSEGRGVDGVDLVDYLDGWFCKQYGDRPYIESIVNDTARFPYDYAGPTTCR